MFQQHAPGCSTRAITWFCPNLSYAYIGALKQAMVTGHERLRNDMADMIERRYALIESEYKDEYFKEHGTARFARATDPHLNDATAWSKVAEYQTGTRKAKYENPGIAASLFYYVKKTMFGENQDVPTDEIGTQKEWDAKRAVLVTRNLQASEGILQDPSSHPRPGDKRPASPPRDCPATQQRERERERESKGTGRDGRESSRAGDGDTRQGKGAGKKGERLTSEGSFPGGRSAEMNENASHNTEHWGDDNTDGGEAHGGAFGKDDCATW